MSKLRFPAVVRGKNLINLDGLQRASRLTVKTTTTNDFFIRKYLHQFDNNSETKKLFTLKKNELIEPLVMVSMQQSSNHTDYDPNDPESYDPFYISIGTPVFSAAFALITLDNEPGNTSVIYDIDTSGLVAVTKRLLLATPVAADTDVMFYNHPGNATQGRGSVLITALKLEV